MKLIKEKHIKSKKEFEQRLLMDNLMEDYFIKLKKDIKIKEYKTTKSSNKSTHTYHGILYSDYLFEYHSLKRELIFRNIFVSMFSDVFGISETRAKSFLKRMIIKHYELDVR